MALIVEYEPGAVSEIKNGVREFRILVFRVKKQKAAAHPEMNNQSMFIIEIKENVLATAMNETNYRAGEPLGKCIRRCFGRKPGTKQCGL